jgi:hypothetical protein
MLVREKYQYLFIKLNRLLYIDKAVYYVLSNELII